jgi:hypothetical protein
MSRRFSTDALGLRGGGVIVLLMSLSLVAFGCAKSDSAKQSSTAASAAPTVAAAGTTATVMPKLPVYPGASLATSNTGTISGKTATVQVYTTRDPFDKVYKWYQAAMPATAQVAHDTSQSQESAVFTLSGVSKQQSVSILKTGGVEVVNITLADTSP